METLSRRQSRRWRNSSGGTFKSMNGWSGLISESNSDVRSNSVSKAFASSMFCSLLETDADFRGFWFDVMAEVEVEDTERGVAVISSSSIDKNRRLEVEWGFFMFRRRPTDWWFWRLLSVGDGVTALDNNCRCVHDRRGRRLFVDDRGDDGDGDIDINGGGGIGAISPSVSFWMIRGTLAPSKEVLWWLNKSEQTGLRDSSYKWKKEWDHWSDWYHRPPSAWKASSFWWK